MIFSLVYLSASPLLAQPQQACQLAHDKISLGQQKLFSIRQKIDEYLQNKPFGRVDRIIAHEQALQQKYRAELDLFEMVAGMYANADTAFGRVKNFLLSTDETCSLENKRRSPLDLWKVFREDPDQFGRLIQTVDLSQQIGADKIDQYTVIQNFIRADEAAQQAVFERLAAEKKLLSNLQYQSRKKQRFQNEILSSDIVAVMREKKPKCFRGVQNIDNPDYQILPYLQRDVPFDVSPVVKDAMCRIGVTDPNWLAGNNLAVLQQRLEAAIVAPNDADSRQWQSQRQNISGYRRFLNAQIPTAAKMDDPEAKRARVMEIERKKQTA